LLGMAPPFISSLFNPRRIQPGNLAKVLCINA
jgi:hypothetical protein